MAIQIIDLTQRPPRSPRVRLAGFVLVPRIFDKGRATIAKKNGEFNYGCPLDDGFLKFVGITADALKKQLATGKGDSEILEWILKNAKHRPSPWEVEAWSRYQEQRVPSDLEMRQYFNEYHSKTAPKRTDVATWFDILDIDDFVTFGGKP
jgi:hypothetical protein